MGINSTSKTFRPLCIGITALSLAGATIPATAPAIAPAPTTKDTAHPSEMAFQKVLADKSTLRMYSRVVAEKDLDAEQRTYLPAVKDPHIRSLCICDVSRIPEKGSPKVIGTLYVAPKVDSYIFGDGFLQVAGKDTLLNGDDIWILYSTDNQLNIALFTEKDGMKAVQGICRLANRDLGDRIVDASLKRAAAPPDGNEGEIRLEISWTHPEVESPTEKIVYSVSQVKGEGLSLATTSGNLSNNLSRLLYTPKPPHGLHELKGGS